jgi:hypothetical protein
MVLGKQADNFTNGVLLLQVACAAANGTLQGTLLGEARWGKEVAVSMSCRQVAQVRTL